LLTINSLIKKLDKIGEYRDNVAIDHIDFKEWNGDLIIVMENGRSYCFLKEHMNDDR
jgi:hypothetical protein